MLTGRRGPNWIHANDTDEPNPIFRIAQETKTPLHTWNDEQLIYDRAGERIPAHVADKLSTLLWKIIEEAFEHSTQDAKESEATISKDASLHDYIKSKAN